MLLPELLDGADSKCKCSSTATAYATDGSCITPSTDTSISSSEPTAWSNVNAVVEPSPENCVGCFRCYKSIGCSRGPMYGILCYLHYAKCS